ncbi:MAG: 50S ribosomal protein L29 [Nanoarchaeota archaeon]
MKFKELKKLDNKSLNDKMKEIRLELMKENAQIAIGTVPKNPGKITLAKKTIARINMLLSDKTSENKNTGGRSHK